MIYLDIETYSELDLRAVGVHKYARSCELMLLSYCVDDGPMINFDSKIHPQILDPEWWVGLVSGHDLCAHNAAFERTVLRSLGLLDLPLDRWHDTMVLGLTLGLPAKLELLCQALGFGEAEGKMVEGKKLVQMFCKPAAKNHKADRYTRENKPAEWETFIAYCEQDAALVRTVWNLLPRFNYDKEYKYWLLDQKINDRGLPIDTELARKAIKLTTTAIDQYNHELDILTFSAITAVTQVQRIKEYLEAQGQEGMNGLGKEEIDQLIENAANPTCRRVLEIRKAAGKSSIAKFQAALNAEIDGRLYGSLQFYGAQRTGRWAGRQLQPQNMMRPLFKDTSTAVKAIKQGTVETYYEDVIEVVSTCVRSVIATRPGKKLVVSDLANIEGRVLAWLAGEKWKLKAYRDYDKGTGPDLYKLAYAKTFERLIESITANERQVGKTMELAFGYQGALGAWAKMANDEAKAFIEALALSRDVDPTEDPAPTMEERIKREILTIVRGWRDAHPRIRSFWGEVEAAAIAAVENPGQVYTCGYVKFAVIEHKGHSWLLCKLPSGRSLWYYSPEVNQVLTRKPWDTGAGETEYLKPVLSYLGQKFLAWVRVATYGGMLVENLTQAVARDVMAHGMTEAEKQGYPLVLTVHDELLAECEEGSHEALSAILATNPEWCLDLPLSAEGYESTFYKKG